MRRPFARRFSRQAVAAACAALLALLAAGPADGQQAADSLATARLSSLRVPGGTAALADAAGVERTTPGGLLLLQIIRAIHEAPPGLDPARDARARRLFAYLADLVRPLPAGDASSRPPADEVPLPLDSRAWRRILKVADEDSDLLTTLLPDRRASLVYYGLMSLDPPTRAYVGARRSLLEDLLKGARPAMLASLGRSIRVREGRIDAPGGARAAAAWEAVVGQRLGDPEAFIPALLDGHDGRAALLYDAIDHLDEARQAFALGLSLPDGSRIDHLKALLRACVPSLVAWDPAIRPFRRVIADPVHLLTITRVLPSGELPAPAGRRFWSEALAASDVPEDAESLVRPGEPDASIDAVWLVQEICVASPARRQQLFRTWALGQRVFAGAPPAALPDVLVALKGVARFPALGLTLERMGIAAPSVHAAAVRRAMRLSEIGDRDTASRSLRQFQGALAVLGRISFSRGLQPDEVRRLVGSLAASSPSAGGDYQGRIAGWLETELLPALAPVPGPMAAAAGTAVSGEATVLAAMAGATSGAPTPAVEWEGLPYRVDVGAAEFARLVAVRQKQGGHRLDDVLAFCREATRLRRPATSPSEVAARVPALAAAVAALADAPLGLLDASDRGPDLRRLSNDAIEDLRTITSAADLPRIERVAEPLERAGDEILARVLASLAYAGPLGDPAGPELLAGDPAARHDFGLGERLREVRVAVPWRLPQRALGVAGGWRMTGSMLGLDVGLATLAVRRLELDGMPPPPGGNDIDRGALAAAVALANPFAVTNADRDSLSDAIRRGRARLAGARAHPSMLAELARAARLNEWRLQVMPWAQANEPGRLAEYFSLADLVRLGDVETAPLPPLHAWGASRLDTEGCLLLRYPDDGSRDALAGRMGTALVAEQFVDLQLRVAEALSDLALPAPLARAILALATQDVLDAYRPAYIDDWSAMVAAVRSLSSGRFVDYLAALTAGGPLVPDDRERPDDVPR